MIMQGKASLDHLSRSNSLQAQVQGFILTCRTEGKSKKTVAFYNDNLQRFLWYVDQESLPTEANRVAPQHVRDFLLYVQSENTRWGGKSESARRPASQMTVRHYYNVLHNFFNWLLREEFVADNPVAHLKKPKTFTRVMQAFSPKQVQMLLDLCDNKTTLGARNRTIMLLLLDTGLRVSELAGLKLIDVDMDTGSLKVMGKGGKERLVHMGAACQKAFWRYLTLYRTGQGANLFLSEEGRLLPSTAVELMIRRLGQRARLTGVRCSAHTFRHTFAINFLRNGGNVFELQYLLGHTSLEMVKRYLGALNADDAAKAHQRCSPVDRLAIKG